MVGKTISHYKITEKLGKGGMGIVYKAEDTKLRRTVALKFLPPELTRDPDSKKRFIREAQAASALQHNNICTIHDVDETEDGQSFIVMDFYEGETLKKKIERKPLDISESIEISIQVAQGLDKAHKKDIVHRDIKPANIMITEEGTPKIVDFGLAKLATQTKLTKEGTTLGTIAYMSPEQTRGESIDHRSDIWSLGVILYEMISGKLPFRGDYDQADKENALSSFNKITFDEHYEASFELAVIYLLLNDQEKAIELIIEGEKDRSSKGIRRSMYFTYLNYPCYKILHNDPRFQEILAKHKELYEENLKKYGDIE